MSPVPVVLCIISPDGRTFSSVRRFEATASVVKAIEAVEQWLAKQPQRLRIAKVNDVHQQPVDPRKTRFEELPVVRDLTNESLREALLSVHQVEPTDATEEWYTEPRTLFFGCARATPASTAREAPLTRRATRATR